MAVINTIYFAYRQHRRNRKRVRGESPGPQTPVEATKEELLNMTSDKKEPEEKK